MNEEEKKLHIKLAYGYYQNKEYKKALDLYKLIYEADKEDYNVVNMLGDTYLKGGNLSKAADYYTEVMNIMEKKGLFPKMIKVAKKASKSFPNDPRIQARIKSAVRSLFRDAEKKSLQKEFAEAREIFENLKEFNSDEFPVNIKLKEINDEEKKHLEHERKMKEHTAEKRTDPQGDLIEKFEKMAQNYLKNGDFDGAVETYITALKLSPGNTGLREKLHSVYLMVAQQSSSGKVWDKIDRSPQSRLEEAKRKALEERNAKIMQEEEERARRVMEEEAKMQHELEEKEMEVIQAAASELKRKLDEAQKKEKLKEEEIQRIMREQEAKKRELLEKVKREAIEKWKKQKEAMQAAEAAAPAPAPAEQQARPAPPPEPKKEQAQPVLPGPPQSKPVAAPGEIELPPPPIPEKKAAPKSIFDALRGAYKTPELNKSAHEVARESEEEKKKQQEAKAAQAASDSASSQEGEMIVNDETLDSLITTAFIYINQNMIKEALRIYNRVSEKYPDNPEVKNIITEISKKQGL